MKGLTRPAPSAYTCSMNLFHTDIGLPKNFVKPTGRVRLVWSRHADRARTDDRYGIIRRFSTATLDRLNVIEVGMEGEKVCKILFRGRYTEDLDVCMVLVPMTKGSWLVKTVWVNERNDTHRTLDRSKYVS